MNKNKIFISGISGDIGKELRKKFKEKDIVKYKRLKSKNKIKIKKQLVDIFENNKIETIFHCSTLFKGLKKEILEFNQKDKKLIKIKLYEDYDIDNFFGLSSKNFDDLIKTSKINFN